VAGSHCTRQPPSPAAEPLALPSPLRPFHPCGAASLRFGRTASAELQVLNERPANSSGEQLYYSPKALLNASGQWPADAGPAHWPSPTGHWLVAGRRRKRKLSTADEERAGFIVVRLWSLSAAWFAHREGEGAHSPLVGALQSVAFSLQEGHQREATEEKKCLPSALATVCGPTFTTEKWPRS